MTQPTHLHVSPVAFLQAAMLGGFLADPLVAYAAHYAIALALVTLAHALWAILAGVGRRFGIALPSSSSSPDALAERVLELLERRDAPPPPPPPPQPPSDPDAR